MAISGIGDCKPCSGTGNSWRECLPQAREGEQGIVKPPYLVLHTCVVEWRLGLLRCSEG